MLSIVKETLTELSLGELSGVNGGVEYSTCLNASCLTQDLINTINLPGTVTTTLTGR